MYNNYNNSPNLMISIGSVVSSQQKTFFNKAYEIWSDKRDCLLLEGCNVLWLVKLQPSLTFSFQYPYTFANFLYDTEILQDKKYISPIFSDCSSQSIDLDFVPYQLTHTRSVK